MQDKLLNDIKSTKNSIQRIELNKNRDDLIENITFDLPKNTIDFSYAIDVICSLNSLFAVKHRNEKFNSYNKNNIAIFPLEAELDEKIYKMLNPFDSANCSIGVINKNEANDWAKLCLDLNYTNSIIVSGHNLPLYSPFGETYIAEAWKNKIFTITLNPKLLDFKEYDEDSLNCESKEENKEIIEAVFQNKIKDAPYQALVVNSALSLYITKRAKSIADAINLAKKTIESKNCYECFRKLYLFI